MKINKKIFLFVFLACLALPWPHVLGAQTLRKIALPVATNAKDSMLKPVTGSTGNTEEATGSSSVQNPVPVFAEPTQANLDISVLESTATRVKARIGFPAQYPLIFTTASDGTTSAQYQADKNYVLISQDGSPALPVYAVKLLVPSDASNLQLTVSGKRSILKPLTLSGAGTAPIPAGNTAVISSVDVLRQSKIVTVKLSPIRYQSATQTIEQTLGLTLTLVYQSQKPNNKIDIVDPEHNVFHKIYKSALANYDYTQVGNTPQAPGKGTCNILTAGDLTNPNYANNNQFWPDYLVIRSSTFQNSNFLNTWLNFRTSSTYGGHDIAVASLNDIVSVYAGASPQEKIRNFLQFVYDHWNEVPGQPSLIYVLLIGDADYGQDSQPWFLPTWDTNNSSIGAAGDNPYGCLVGTDDLPDVIVGRWPVKNDTEMSRIIAKTIFFNLQRSQLVNSFGSRNLFLGGEVFSSSNPIVNGARDVLIAHHQEAEEYNNSALYNPNYPDFTFSQNDPGILDLLNEEGCLVVSYNGEGTEQGWTPDNISVADISNHTRMTALVISAASSTARFDFPSGDCYAEQWIKGLEKGALGFFGASRDQSFGHAYWADETILKSIYEDGITVLGAAAMSAKLTDHFAYENNRKKYNYLGDPAVDIAGHIQSSTKPEIVITNSASHVDHLAIGDPVNIRVHVKNVGLGAAQGLTSQLYYVDSDFNLIPVGEQEALPDISAGQTRYFTRSTTYQEHFNDYFRAKTNVIDELSEYNNTLTGGLEVKYPFHIDQNGPSGTPNGSYAHPFTNLADAMEYIDDRHSSSVPLTIYFYPGTYGGATGQEHISHDLRLIGAADPGEVVIQGDGFMLDGKNTIQNITFESCDLISPVHTVKDVEISQSVFKGNYVAVNAEGFYGEPCPVKLFNNIFTANTYPVALSGENISAAFINNVVFSNTRFLSLSLTNGAPNSLLIKNNIIRESMQDLQPENISIANNYNNTDLPYLLDTGSNNINLSPLFVNAVGGDFHLQASSPCINAGDPAALYNDINGTRNDMGAFGGPSIFLPVKILSPADGANLYYLTFNALNVKWQALTIAPDENVRLKIYHYEPVINQADTGTTSVKKTSGIKAASYGGLILPKTFLSPSDDLSDISGGPSGAVPYADVVVDLDTFVANSGQYSVGTDVLNSNRTYTIEISDPENPSAADSISFSLNVSYPQR